MDRAEREKFRTMRIVRLVQVVQVIAVVEDKKGKEEELVVESVHRPLPIPYNEAL